MKKEEMGEVAVEMNEIFKYAPKEFLDKIPNKIKEYLNDIKVDNYKFQYDLSKTLKEQNLKKETRGMLCLLYKDYICNNEQKERYIKQIEKIKQDKEKEKELKYSYNNLFNKNIEKQENTQTSIITYKKENFLQRIIKKINRKEN